MKIMREQAIDFILSNASVTLEEVESWTDAELIDYMGRISSIED